MSTITKEPMPSPTLVAAGPDGTRRTDAVGAEIPVIVHASRYSAAKGVGKQLPPVHEETRTVIVFPQGAVVRLTANMTVGELVVLTNRQTGADALCRVVNVKTQPGIQNYVNLEFTQRAPGFWGECIQSDRAEVPPAPAPVATPTALPTTAPAEAKPMSRELLTPVAPEPSFASPSQRAASTFGLSGTLTEPTAPTKVAPSRAQSQSWSKPSLEPIRSDAPSNTKKIAMIAAAAAILVGVGIGAGMVLLRGSHSAPQVQAATSPANNAPESGSSDTPSQPDFSENALPAQPTSVANSSAPVPAPTPAVAVEARPVSRTEASRPAVPAPAPASAPVQPSIPNVNVGKISAPVTKSSPRVMTNDAPPVPVVGAQTSLTGGALNGGLLGNAVGSAPVPAPELPKGGVIQQPKLISSVSAVYPPSARAAHIQGDVVVEAVVDATGKVTSAKAVSGPLLLQSAAVDAVRSWKYQPAQLDGKPIEVQTKVSLSFHLQ